MGLFTLARFLRDSDRKAGDNQQGVDQCAHDGTREYRNCRRRSKQTASQKRYRLEPWSRTAPWYASPRLSVLLRTTYRVLRTCLVPTDHPPFSRVAAFPARAATAGTKKTLQWPRA